MSYDQSTMEGLYNMLARKYNELVGAMEDKNEEVKKLRLELNKFKNKDNLTFLEGFVNALDKIDKLGDLFWMPTINNFGKFWLQHLAEKPKSTFTVEDFKKIQKEIINIIIPEEVMDNPIIKTVKLAQKLIRTIELGEGDFYVTKFSMEQGKLLNIYFLKGGGSFEENCSAWFRNRAISVSDQPKYHPQIMACMFFQNWNLLRIMNHWQDVLLIRKNISDKEFLKNETIKEDVNEKLVREQPRSFTIQEHFDQKSKVSINVQTQTLETMADPITLYEELKQKNEELFKNNANYSREIRALKEELNLSNNKITSLLNKNSMLTIENDKLKSEEHKKDKELSLERAKLELENESVIKILFGPHANLKLPTSLATEEIIEQYNKLVHNASYSRPIAELKAKNEELERVIADLKAKDYIPSIEHIKVQIGDFIQEKLTRSLGNAEARLENFNRQLDQLQTNWEAIKLMGKGLPQSKPKSKQKKPIPKMDELHNLDESQINSNIWQKLVLEKPYLSNTKSMPYSELMSQGEWSWQKRINMKLAKV